MIRLEIDEIPPSLNRWAKLHWSEQRMIKQDWAWMIKAAVLTAKVGRPMYRLAAVKITLIFPVIRRRDIDNYTPKMVMDGLVNAGIIQDDRADWVDVKWGFAQGAERQTIIEVEQKNQMGNNNNNL